jgi:hypothetical protein
MARRLLSCRTSFPSQLAWNVPLVAMVALHPESEVAHFSVATTPVEMAGLQPLFAVCTALHLALGEGWRRRDPSLESGGSGRCGRREGRSLRRGSVRHRGIVLVEDDIPVVSTSMTSRENAVLLHISGLVEVE